MKTQQVDLASQAVERKRIKEDLEAYIVELGKADVSISRIASLTGKHVDTIRPILKRFGLR